MENVVQPSEVSQPQSSKGVNAWSGLIQVFYAPAELFTKLKDSPKVLVPYVFIALLTFAAFWLIKDLLVNELMTMPQVQKQLEMSQGQMNEEQFKKVMAVTQAFQWTILYMLCPLAAAGLAYFWGSFVMGGTARFKQLLSIMLYGEVIFAAAAIIMVPLMLAKGDIFVSISLGAIVPDKSFTNALYTVLSKIDLFIIWEVIVIGIGLSIIYGFKRNKGYLLSVLSMGLLTVLAMISAVISSMFT